MKNNLRLRLWEETSGRCVYCGHPVTLEGMEADHIIPKSAGGENGFMNRVCSCPACNDAKADSLLEAFLLTTMSEGKKRSYRHRLETLVEQGKMSESKARALNPLEYGFEEPDLDNPLELTDWQVVSVLADILIEKLSAIRYYYGREKNKTYRRTCRQQEAGSLGSPY